MVVEGQQGTKNASLISSVRTPHDSKLRLIFVGDRPSLNSIGVPPSLVISHNS
ncbi:hypothetical protein BHE74_00024925 [Ensete ventricosum]|nr:hypothetical protein BHE74_00024925 [Ensete ventricosum]